MDECMATAGGRAEIIGRYLPDAPRPLIYLKPTDDAVFTDRQTPSLCDCRVRHDMLPTAAAGLLGQKAY